MKTIWPQEMKAVLCFHWYAICWNERKFDFREWRELFLLTHSNCSPFLVAQCSQCLQTNFHEILWLLRWWFLIVIWVNIFYSWLVWIFRFCCQSIEHQAIAVYGMDMIDRKRNLWPILLVNSLLNSRSIIFTDDGDKSFTIQDAWRHKRLFYRCLDCW